MGEVRGGEPKGGFTLIEPKGGFTFFLKEGWKHF
jgi:hypothetical protein